MADVLQNCPADTAGWEGHNVVANKVARWAAGERTSLWNEVAGSEKRQRRKAAEQTLEKQAAVNREAVIALARRGLPGKAIQLAASDGLAPDTDRVADIMMSKFVAPPPAQRTSRRAPAPPANELLDDAMARAVRSFARGVGAGPTGMRPDFLKQIVGEETDRPGLAILSGICNLLADGRAPKYLRPFLGGAKGTALFKRAKNGDDDARPACSGEAIRRLVSKALLATEAGTLAEHLLPQQLAAPGVGSGVEAMPHVVRQWHHDFAADPNRVIVSFDEGNAHNEVDRHTFLSRMRELAPGICRWLQQGCPLIGACHAVVQRILLEGIGVLPVAVGTTPVVPVLDPPACLDMTPGFADDGHLAGPAVEVLRAIDHMALLMPRLGLRFSTLKVAPACVGGSAVDFTAFTSRGCEVLADGNYETLKSPIGSSSWCKHFCKEVASKQSSVLAELEDAQVAHYLMRWSVNAGRLNYLARTTPSDLCGDALVQFDRECMSTFVKATGLALSQQQQTQLTLSPKEGGLGLKSAALTADAAYIGSRAATHGLCVAVRPAHAWDVADSSPLLAAWRRTCSGTPVPTAPSPELLKGLKQSTLSQAVEQSRVRRLRAEAPADDLCRLNAYSAGGAGVLLGVTPSKTLDNNLSSSEFATVVACQLGVDVMEGGSSCCFCGQLLDCKGRHAWSCMAGGDTVATHNEVRDIVFDYCRRGGLRPDLEAARLLSDSTLPDGRRRPADVLVVAAAALSPFLPDGSRSCRVQPVALDFAIVNALGQGHWQQTLQHGAAAAEAYSDQKRRHLDTQAKCHAAGIKFQPMVLTAQGAWAKEAWTVLRAIATAVAGKEDRRAAALHLEIAQRIAVAIARSGAKAVKRRMARPDMANHSCRRAAADLWRENPQ